VVTFIITVTVIVGGVLIWGLHFRAGALPGLLVTMILGTAAFTALGIGLTRLIPNAESGPVVVNLLILPLTFISNIWFPTDTLPSALKSIAGVFPIRALANGLQFVFDPRRHGAGLDGSSLRVLAIWTVIGVVMMVKFLRQPQGEVA
jgi:ABC-2 type transport system permease protein